MCIFGKKDITNSPESDDEFILLNGVDRNDTNKIITDLIGTYEDYVMTSFCLQKEVNFIDYPQSKKKEFLMKILKLNIYDELLDLSKVTHRAKNLKLKELTDKTKNIDIYELRNNLSDNETKRKEIQESIEKINSLIEKYHSKIELCNKKLVNIKTNASQDSDYNASQYSDYNEYIDKNKLEIESTQKQLNIIQNNYNKYCLELKKYQSEYNKFDSVQLEKNYIEFKENKIILDKELNAKLKQLYENKRPTREFDLSYDEYTDKQKKHQSKISILDKKIVTLKESIKDISKLDIISKQYEEYMNMENQLDNYNVQLANLDKEISQMNSKLEKLKVHKYDKNCKYCINNIFVKDAIETKEKLEIKMKEYNDLKELIDKLNKSMNLKKYLNIKENYEELTNYKQDNIKIQNQIKDLDHQHILLTKEIESLDKIIQDYNSELENIEYNENILKEISEIEEKIESNKEKEYDEYNSYLVLKNKINELNILVKEKKDKIDKFSNKIIQLTNKNKEYEATIENMKEYIEATKNNKMLESEIEEIKGKISKCQNEIKKQTLQKDSLLENIFILKKEIEVYDNHSKIIKELEKETILYKNYTKLVNKDGLPYILLNNLIPELQSGTNNILLPLTNFSITIEQEKDSINIYKINEKNKLNIELCSGFEKFVVNLAIRISLSNLSKLSSCNFMLIDEGFSCMDNTNINNLNSLFTILKDMFDFVIVISHLDSVKSQCDEYLTIDKNKDGSSKIIYT